MPKCVSSGSLIWRPIVSTGFRLVIGSWKIIAICRPLSPRISRSFILSRSRPSKRAVPERTRPARGSSPSSASAVTLLPQPDSPTIPSVSPGEISNEIPLTAWTSPLPVQNWTRRSSTERSGSLDATDRLPPTRPQVREPAPLTELPCAAAELRIERLAQAVADQVEPEHREHDRDPGNDREPRRRLQIVVDVAEHRPPLRRRRVLRPEPEEAEARDIDDRGRHRQRPLHDHRRDRVREDVREENRTSGHADRARSEDEVVFTLGENRTTEKPGENRNVYDSDRDHDLVEPGAECRDDADREQQSRNREHDVHGAHDHRVGDSTHVTGDRAENQPDREPDRDGDDADEQRVSGPVQDARVDVASELVDAEPVGMRRSRAATAGDQNQILILRPSVGEHGREDCHGHED